MRHMLKIDGIVLLFIAAAYLVVVFMDSENDFGIYILPTILVALISAMGFFEVDRRFQAIEQSQAEMASRQPAAETTKTDTSD